MAQAPSTYAQTILRGGSRQSTNRLWYPPNADDRGSLLVNTETDVSTFALAGSVGTAASATDIVALQNPAANTTTILRVVHIEISHLLASTILQAYVILRGNLNTGGTFSTPSPQAHDQNDGGTQATTRVYTANPSALGAGNAVGAVTLNTGSPFAWDFGSRGKPLILRAGQACCLFLNGTNGASSAGVLFNIRYNEVNAT
jgi:hypothetical protein